MENKGLQSSPEISEKNPQLSLQKCISVLEAARNDNERFAALLLVTQLVHSNSVDSAGRRSLFNAVGFNFINRLLNSRNVPNECPQDVYRSLALTILACFATDEEFLVHPEMTSKIPLLLASISDEEENQGILDDCFQILSSLASSSIGCRHLARKEAFSTLCQIAGSVNQEKSKKAVEIIVRIVNNSPRAMWEEQAECLLETLKALSKSFKEAQDYTKFELCNSLVLLLAGADKSVFQRVQEKEWLEDIYAGVKQILQSKVSSRQRDPAIILVSLVTELVGMDWMVGSAGRESPGLFIVSMTIASIETRMILDGKTLEEITPKADVLISCYNILEKAINFAVVNAGTLTLADDTHLSSSLPKVYSLATVAIHSIMQFLENVASAQDKGILNGKPSQLVYASVRVLCAWMAEETYALQDNICKLLPFLLKLGKECLDTSAESVLDTRTHKTEEPGTSTASYAREVDIVRFLLPPLCHLSADDKTRKILIDNEGLELVSSYFFQRWKIWNGQGKNDADFQESEMCIVTMLGILLNFLVTEPKLAVNNHAFQEIGQHAIASAPLLLLSERNVVILVNLIVLGLLFIRSHVEHNLTFNCEELSKFLRASIYILKETKPLIHDNGDQFLKHSKTQLVDISELWFIGLQVVSDLVNSLPIMRGLLKESGWIDVISNHLNTSREDQELSRDETDVLLDLVRKVNDF